MGRRNEVTMFKRQEPAPAGLSIPDGDESEEREDCMYYYEKDYIMRLILGIAQMLAYLFFGKTETDLPAVMSEECRENCDYLRRMVDSGQINAAEDKLFDLLETAGWAEEQKAALIISFYDHINEKDDDFLGRAGFSREEIYSGLEDALKMIGKEIPEYMRLQ